MTVIVKAQSVTKRYGDFHALKNINLEIGEGQIVGLIGPNGAGKTTALRCLLGLATYEGSLRVLGKEPHRQRAKLLQEVAYIADTAVLPKWIRVDQLLEHIAGVHKKFDLARAHEFLANTEIQQQQAVRTLSKGMVTQLHLALAISIDARLLVLDEPTLGLDILYRKRFYEQLLNDFLDRQRSIIITTHQVEEIEQLLTDLVFIKQGHILLDLPMDEIHQRFFELEIRDEQLEQARTFNPISERNVLGGKMLLFEDVDPVRLSEFGSARTPSIADLYVAKMA